MKEFLDVTAEMASHAQALKDIHKDVVEGKDIVSYHAPRWFHEPGRTDNL